MNKILQQLTCQKKIRHQYTMFFSASRTGAPVCSQFQAAKALGDISTLRAASGTSELTAQFKSCSAGGRPWEWGWLSWVQEWLRSNPTVDASEIRRSPVEEKVVEIPSFTGFGIHPRWLVWDFFHQP